MAWSLGFLELCITAEQNCVLPIHDGAKKQDDYIHLRAVGLIKEGGKKSHVRFLAKWWPLSKSERLSSVLGEISYLGFLSSQLLIAVCSKERGHTSLFKIFFVQEDFFLRTLELYMLLTESELEMAMNLNCHPLLQLKLQSLGNVICDS